MKKIRQITRLKIRSIDQKISTHIQLRYNLDAIWMHFRYSLDQQINIM